MLSGAKEIIKTHKPKLAISIYHSVKDFVEIPRYILNLNTAYRMAVCSHGDVLFDTILYCY